jgi:nitrogen fixation/metabolism regulation signal transduction histidine kinase
MRPVRMMTDMANRFGRGELSARASGAGLPAEFVPLARAFDAMASQLSEREREMLAANDRLTVIASHDLVSGWPIAAASRAGSNSNG